jgi:hypothetical protein
MKTRLFLLIGIFGLLIYSCKMPGGIANYPTREFWALNWVTETYYQLTAELLYRGRDCDIWVEKGSGVNANTARVMANEYENSIYPKMMAVFGDTFDFGQDGIFNTMELADYLRDNDGKLCILLLDIQDGYGGPNDSYVGGYFDGNNFSPKSQNPYSNECDMIYVDTHPGNPGSPASNETVAHEMQHMMNYVTSLVNRSNQNNQAILMDEWINEGLSSAAEWVYSQRHPEGRWRWYNEDTSGLIHKGNNFFVWGNRLDENLLANLDDYSTVYLFFQWLRLQSGGSNDIYKKIMISNHHNHEAVTTAAHTAISGQGYDNWNTLLKTWLAANYHNNPNGAYGYKNDPTLKNIKARWAPASSIIQLAQGEGVYSAPANSVTLNTSGTNIRYANLSANAANITVYPGNIPLLTYNVNTVVLYDGNYQPIYSPEPGTTTGAGAGGNMVSASRSVQVQPAPFTGPYKIDGADMLRRNRHRQGAIND